MKKLLCIIGIVTVLIVTFVVLTTDVGTNNHTIKITQQQTSFSNTSNTKLNSNNLTLNNKDVNTNNKNLNLNIEQINNTQSELENRSVHVYNTNGSISRTDINHLKAGLHSEKTLSPMSHFVSNEHVKVYNTPNRIPNNKGFINNNVNVTPSTQEYKDIDTSNYNSNHYVYKSLDWSTWRSNFINKITDDSIYVESLNNYPQGSMFAYSFMVDNTGKIYDVKVRSFQLSREDKDKVAQLIKSYEHTNITKFPPNSKRKMVKVSAILLLSDKTEYSRPSDFHDLEQIRLNF